MTKTKIILFLTTGRQFETEVDNYDSKEIVREVSESPTPEVCIGEIAFNKHYFQATAPVSSISDVKGEF